AVAQRRVEDEDLVGVGGLVRLLHSGRRRLARVSHDRWSLSAAGPLEPTRGKSFRWLAFLPLSDRPGMCRVGQAQGLVRRRLQWPSAAVAARPAVISSILQPIELTSLLCCAGLAPGPAPSLRSLKPNRAGNGKCQSPDWWHNCWVGKGAAEKSEA